jgi:glycosyltransferase involved in cell wall biosynthesis
MRRVLIAVNVPHWSGVYAVNSALCDSTFGAEVETVVLVPETDEHDTIARRFSPRARLRAQRLGRLRAARNVGANLRFLAGLPASLAELRGLLREERIDAVVNAGYHHVAVPLAAHGIGVPVVWQLHSDMAPGWSRRVLGPLARRTGAAFVMNGSGWQARFPELADQAGRSWVFNPTVDAEAFGFDPAARERVRTALGIPPDATVVGTVGHRTRQKRHDQFLDLLERLRRDDDVYGVVVGQDRHSARTWVQNALAPRLENEALAARVRLVTPDRPVADYLSAFDLFALTSEDEGIPVVLAEAGANGLPVVASAVGSVGALLEDGRNARLYPFGDLAGAEAASRALLSAGGRDAPEARRLTTDVRVRCSTDQLAAAHRAALAHALAAA